MQFDILIFQSFNGFAGQNRFLDFLGIFSATYLPFLLVAAAMVLVLTEKQWRKRWYDFFFITCSVLLARGLITPVIRIFYHRDRPFIAMPETVIKLIEKGSEASFPSGHAIAFFALSMAVYYVRPKFALYFFAGAGLIGISRVFVGVHYPLDILAGAVLGIFSAYIVHKMFPKLPVAKSEEII